MAKNKYKQTTYVPKPIKPDGDETINALDIENASDNVGKFYGGHSVFLASHLKTIEDYCKAMAPGVAVDPDEGVLHHKQLYKAIMSILLADDVRDMVKGMDSVMALFRRESRGALNNRYLFRFFEEWVIDEEQRQLYSGLMLLITTFANPVDRERYGDKFDFNNEKHPFLKELEASARSRLIAYLRRYTE